MLTGLSWAMLIGWAGLGLGLAVLSWAMLPGLGLGLGWAGLRCCWLLLCWLLLCWLPGCCLGSAAESGAGVSVASVQFFLTFKATPHLDGRHVVFGRVERGMATLELIQKVSTDKNDRPRFDVVISDCGQLGTLVTEHHLPSPPLVLSMATTGCLLSAASSCCYR